MNRPAVAPFVVLEGRKDWTHAQVMAELGAADPRLAEIIRSAAEAFLNMVRARQADERRTHSNAGGVQ